MDAKAPLQDFEPLMRPNDAAALLGIHPVTLLRWAREGRVPSRRLGRKISFRASELNSWYQRQPGFKLEVPFVPPNPKGRQHD